MLTVIFIVYFLNKWVFPCSASAFAMDENVLDLRNNLAPIPWLQIDQVVYKTGKYRNVIGIKLKNINDYTLRRLPVKNRLQLKINRIMYGCDFCIPVMVLKDRTSLVFESINNFFIRVRLGNAGWVTR